MSIQRRSFQLRNPASASCTPLAPSTSVHLNGAPSNKCRMNISHSTFELEGGIGGVVDVGLVSLAVLVPALGNMGRAQTGHALHLTKEIVEHVAPVAEHVEDDAAALVLLVVPRGALRRLPVTLEHPIAELAAHGEEAPEEAGIDQRLELAQARQEQLVLYHAMPNTGLCGG